MKVPSDVACANNLTRVFSTPRLATHETTNATLESPLGSPSVMVPLEPAVMGSRASQVLPRYGSISFHPERHLAIASSFCSDVLTLHLAPAVTTTVEKRAAPPGPDSEVA